MARSLLAGKAVAGIVNAVDREHREVVTTNRAPDGRRAGLQRAHSGATAANSAAVST